MKYTTRDLSRRLIKSIQEDSIAERNSVARAAASLVSVKQLEINAGGKTTQPVVLDDGQTAA